MSDLTIQELLNVCDKWAPRTIIFNLSAQIIQKRLEAELNKEV